MLLGLHGFRPAAWPAAILLFSLVFFALVLALPPPAQSHTTNQSKALQKAGLCQKRLLASPKAKKYRHQWEKCIRLYDRFLGQKGSLRAKQEGYFQSIRLHLGLAQYSGRGADLEKAARQVREFQRRYPKNRLSDRLEAELGRIRGHFPSHRSPAPAKVRDIRHWSHSDYTRVVFDLSSAVSYQDNRRFNPDLLVIDLKNTRLNEHTPQSFAVKDGVLHRIRTIQHTPDTVRALLELEGVSKHRIVFLSDPDRMVVDLFGRNGKTTKTLPPEREEVKRIVIDPGHGGKDPGALGRGGLAEKDVVLDIALRLRKLIEANLGKEVLMTREKDVFIPLKERTQFANEKGADLFISIHVNSAPTRRARGVEVYTLGQATDSGALATAARENSLSEESLKNLDGAVRSMLADLSVSRRLDQSLELAHATHRSLLKHAGSRYDLVGLGVKQAPFYVLMNAGMPSILAEVSFISHPVEGKRLASKTYREKIAFSLYRGIEAYLFKTHQTAKVGNLTP